MIQICKSCRNSFEIPDHEKYKTLCRDCFIQSKRNETEQLKAENETLRGEIEELNNRIKQLEADLAFRSDKHSLGLFELIKLKNTALEHEIEELKNPLPTV